MRLVGTTKHTIAQIRDRTHWNIQTLSPMDPVTLGLCSQIDLDFEVMRASKGQPQAAEPVTTLLPAEVTTHHDEDGEDEARPNRDVDLSRVFDRFPKSE
jgi:hypothetical protein